MTTPEGNDSLDSARQWLRARLDDGERCPCCTQFAKVYRRKIYSTMARTLIAMWRRGSTTEWLDINDVRKSLDLKGGGDGTKMRYWDLIEAHPDLPLWRVTSLGEQWVRDTITVPRYARIYDNRCLSLVGDPVTIREALGVRFNYNDLMRGV